MTPGATDRRDLWCLLLLLAIATIFFADVIFAGSNFYHRDLFIYHFPMKRIVRDAMLSGEFPFWNRSYSNGQPLAANPAYELFYPPQWLILVGSYPFGFALHIVFHVYAALIGMFLLLRAMTLGRAAATFGALSFGMGGFLLGSKTMLPTFFVWALAPIVGWSVLRVAAGFSPPAEADGHTWSRVAVAALLAGMQLVIGEPVARLFGVADTRGIDWIELILQVIVAAIGVVTTSGDFRVLRGDEVVGTMPVAALVDDCPLYDLETAAPPGSLTGRALPRPPANATAPAPPEGPARASAGSPVRWRCPTGR